MSISSSARFLTGILVFILGGIFTPAIFAQEPPSLQRNQTPNGLQITWRGVAETDATGLPAIAKWPLVELGGARLPAKLIAVKVDNAAELHPQIRRLKSVPWPGGALPAAKIPAMPLPDGGERQPLATVQSSRSSQNNALPALPLIALRQSFILGTRVVVLAVTPFFEQNGQIQTATEFQAFIPGATLFTGDAATILLRSENFENAPSGSPTSPLWAGGAGRASSTINPAAAQSAWKVSVSEGGMQRLSGADLSAAGFPADAPLSQIQLWHNGVETALEERGTDDGQLDPGDELRFYAPAPGDRWNAADTYWLIIGASAGRRMSTRSVAPGAAPLRSTALQRGVWRHNQIYASTQPGPDGDHWFAADLRAGPGQPPPTMTISLPPTLPLASGPVTLTVAGSAVTSGQHHLKVEMGAAVANVTWSGQQDWTQSLTLALNAAGATLSLTPGSAPDGLEIDSVGWERPVRLDFGGRGAEFAGVAGEWRYQLSNLPAGRALYDISRPYTPTALSLLTGATVEFEDGPSPRQYLLAAAGTLRTPSITAHSPLDLSAPLNADTLYIAPSQFHAALAPLATHRAGQGHAVRVIDVQAIYDTWSFGQVSPDAIRNFLRYAAATWNRPPSAVTLVGDATSDPHNYTGRNNANLIPPYLAMVDPWLGETACETCYAQLDGDNPLDDSLPDLALGRLPVKSVAELSDLVAKLIAYETSPGGAWQARSVYIADNYRDANNVPDGAGDFAALADISVALQPEGLDIRRMYYDPSPSNPGDPWREADAVTAYQRTLALWNKGAGLVNYHGHSHHWQWASTNLSANPPYLMGLYDADALTNHRQPSILLEMTCLTGAFQTPAYSGTTLDERFLLHPTGGAAAVWAPTGLGVTYGHDSLQRGFYQALWKKTPPITATLGALTTAGYLELFANGDCCQDALRTFALLGDPLTPARVLLLAHKVYLPLIARD